MFRICQSLMVFGFVFILATCATSGGGNTPIWVNAPESVYPHAQYITGMGTGMSKAEAEQDAIAKVARTFGTTVSIRSEGITSYSTRNGSTEGGRDFNAQTIVSVYAELFDLKYTPAWRNPQTKEWTTLAYINRERAWEIYEPRVAAAARSFVNLYNKAGALTDPLNKYIRYRDVAVIANEAGGISDALLYAQVLFPQKTASGIYKEAQNALADISAQISHAADWAVISVQCDNDFEGIVTGAVIDVFRQSGFKASTANARGVTNRAYVKIDEGKEKFDSGTFFTPRMVLTVSSDNNTLFTWTANAPRKGASDERTAKRNAWNALADKIRDYMPQEFNAALEGITRRDK